MEAQNPYAAPIAAATAMPGERVDFVDLDTPRLKKLYHRSVNLGTIGVLLVLGGVLLMSLPLWLPEGMGIPVFRLVVLPRFVAPLIGVFELVAAYGLFARPGWGRPVGIIASAYIITGLNLIAIIVGIAGIVACSGAGAVRRAARPPRRPQGRVQATQARQDRLTGVCRGVGRRTLVPSDRRAAPAAAVSSSA